MIDFSESLSGLFSGWRYPRSHTSLFECRSFQNSFWFLRPTQNITFSGQHKTFSGGDRNSDFNFKIQGNSHSKFKIQGKLSGARKTFRAGGGEALSKQI